MRKRDYEWQCKTMHENACNEWQWMTTNNVNNDDEWQWMTIIYD